MSFSRGLLLEFAHLLREGRASVDAHADFHPLAHAMTVGNPQLEPADIERIEEFHSRWVEAGRSVNLALENLADIRAFLRAQRETMAGAKQVIRKHRGQAILGAGVFVSAVVLHILFQVPYILLLCVGGLYLAAPALLAELAYCGVSIMVKIARVFYFRQKRLLPSLRLIHRNIGLSYAYTLSRLTGAEVA